MVNYQNGKVYKIEDLNGEMCYIGSTTKDMLCKRMAEHRNTYASFKRGTAHKFTVFDIFEKYGVEQCRIVLIELCPCDTKDELTSRESHYIRSMKCVNNTIPDRTLNEYRITNNEVIRAQKAKIIDCACGFTYTSQNKLRHMRSIKHLNALANQVLTI